MASDQAIRDLEPLVRRLAGAAHRLMPASADIEDVRQVARIAGWRALQSFRGGSFEGFAAQRMQHRIKDWQRDQIPGGRNAEPFEFVGDDALDNVAAPDDHAADYERRQYLEHRMSMMEPRTRGIIERIFAGEAQVSIAKDLGLSQPQIVWLIRGGRSPAERAARKAKAV